MADQRDGGISWTDETWNPIRGCSRVSEGCRNCYAETMAARFTDPGQAYEGLAKRTPSGPRWTGEVRLIDKHLDDPLRWQRPRRIFVNSMSDLFHEKLRDEQIDRVFAVMALAPQHTFQVLTKRAERMRDYLNSRDMWIRLHDVVVGMAHRDRLGELVHSGLLKETGAGTQYIRMPLPNVWLGVSVEDQETADERIPWLLQTPAAVRWVSYEPALGPVDFGESVGRKHGAEFHDKNGPCTCGKTRLDWTVVGGESGPGARPFDIQWARDTIKQCKAAGVPVFVKQLGAYPIDSSFETGTFAPEDKRSLDAAALGMDHAGFHVVLLKDKKGGVMSEWPEQIRVREMP